MGVELDPRRRELRPPVYLGQVVDALPGVSGVYEEGELRRGPTEVEYGQRGRCVVSPTQAGAVLQEDEGKPSEEALINAVHDAHSILVW